MNIVLGVCGSISAYRSYDVLRGLIKQDHQVKVVLTKGAEHFVQGKVFRYLGATEVYTAEDDFFKREQTILHIDLRDWMDRLIIAPASANTLAKLANGMCDDLLCSLFLSSESKEKIIFPAMNTSMLNNSITQDNFSRLEKLDLLFIHPTLEGVLACGDQGEGKLPLPETICDFSDCFGFHTTQKTYLITTGATKAPIDPVRYLTNPASGKTGIELARTYLKQGHQVIVVAGEDTKIPTGFQAHPRLTWESVKTTPEMHQAVEKYFGSCDIYISAAAISDFQFDYSPHKIKKTKSPTLDYHWGVDILKTVLDRKTHQKVVGFAAESTLSDEIMLEKFQRKPVDLLVANRVAGGFQENQVGFGQEQNQYTFIKKGKIINSLTLMKQDLASAIMENLND